MDPIAATISEHFRNNDVGAVATPAIRVIREWLIADDLTRQTFDSLEPELTHLASDERKGLLLDFVMSFALACSEDLELDDHEMECLGTLKRLFRIEDGDFVTLRRDRLHDVIGAQLDLIIHDYKVDQAEDLLLANLQGFSVSASTSWHPLLTPIS